MAAARAAARRPGGRRQAAPPPTGAARGRVRARRRRDRCAELDRLSARTAVAEYDGSPRCARSTTGSPASPRLTAGTSADNERKMRLESYVLAARLEQVAAAATARLRRMSSGRYTLVHSDDRAGRRRAAGSGCMSSTPGPARERDTATLSGGETFFASLALALGLADVVTDEAGGVRLDTLFIDEGFGSLDDQTLDEVLDVLDSLRERDRSVGIVSHVADLRRRIPAQLEVVKERHGSVVRQRGGRPTAQRLVARAAGQRRGVDDAGGHRAQRADLARHLLQMAHRPGGDLDDEAVVARHMVRLQDLGRDVDQVVERLVVAVRIPEPYEGQDRQAEPLRVDDRRVPLDDTGLLQPPHPLGDRARRTWRRHVPARRSWPGRRAGGHRGCASRWRPGNTRSCRDG